MKPRRAVLTVASIAFLVFSPGAIAQALNGAPAARPVSLGTLESEPGKASPSVLAQVTTPPASTPPLAEAQTFATVGNVQVSEGSDLQLYVRFDLVNLTGSPLLAAAFELRLGPEGEPMIRGLDLASFMGGGILSPRQTRRIEFPVGQSDRATGWWKRYTPELTITPLVFADGKEFHTLPIEKRQDYAGYARKLRMLSDEALRRAEQQTPDAALDYLRRVRTTRDRPAAEDLLFLWETRGWTQAKAEFRKISQLPF